MDIKKIYAEGLAREINMLEGQKSRAEEKLKELSINAVNNRVEESMIDELMHRVELLDEDIMNKNDELSEL